MNTCPNKQPTITAVPYRIALIGEAPGRRRNRSGGTIRRRLRPFPGGILSAAGIIRDACFIGNVCQTRPADNDISQFKWDGPEIQAGLKTARV